MSIKISLFGTEILAGMLSRASGFVISPRLRRVLEDAKNVGVAGARKFVPRRSHFLHSRIGGEVKDFGTDNPKLLFGANTNYAKFVEFGTKGPYEIRPRTKRWLRWTENSRGTRVSTPPGIIPPAGLTVHWRRRVMHPGIKAQPYFGPMLEKLKPRLLMAIKRVLNEHIKAAGA